ncbi:6723_t:CDS:2 [Entrophospora sp. SA101]|nr:6723_t:CDS:2 [Entrophospora sp. SA101]
MDTDIYPNNPPPKKNFEEADKIIHLDYPQLMRAVSYVNEIVEEEIEAGIPPEKIFVAGYSQGGLLTLATTLISQHKLDIVEFLEKCLNRKTKKRLNKTDDRE